MTSYVPYHYGTALARIDQEDKDIIVQWSEDMLSQDDKRKLGQLDRIIDSMPPLLSPLSVYRGIRVEDWKEIIFDINHFVATATNAAATRYFGGATGCYMEIQLPPDAKVLPLSYQHGLTRYPKDMEVLLPRKGVFKVVGSRKIDLEEHNDAMFGAEIAKMIAEAMARSNFTRRVDEKTFVIVQYLPNGRMTRSLANHNTEMLAKIYGVD